MGIVIVWKGVLDVPHGSHVEAEDSFQGPCCIIVQLCTESSWAKRVDMHPQDQEAAVYHILPHDGRNFFLVGSDIAEVVHISNVPFVGMHCSIISYSSNL